jgi:hypothetical protein
VDSYCGCTAPHLPQQKTRAFHCKHACQRRHHPLEFQMGRRRCRPGAPNAGNARITGWPATDSDDTAHELISCNGLGRGELFGSRTGTRTSIAPVASTYWVVSICTPSKRYTCNALTRLETACATGRQFKRRAAARHKQRLLRVTAHSRMLGELPAKSLRCYEEGTVAQVRKILSPHRDLENCYCARRETSG